MMKMWVLLLLFSYLQVAAWRIALPVQSNNLIRRKISTQKLSRSVFHRLQQGVTDKSDTSSHHHKQQQQHLLPFADSKKKVLLSSLLSVVPFVAWMKPIHAKGATGELKEMLQQTSLFYRLIVKASSVPLEKHPAHIFFPKSQFFDWYHFPTNWAGGRFYQFYPFICYTIIFFGFMEYYPIWTSRYQDYAGKEVATAKITFKHQNQTIVAVEREDTSNRGDIAELVGLIKSMVMTVYEYFFPKKYSRTVVYHKNEEEKPQQQKQEKEKAGNDLENDTD
jgi:hypothetical protein